MLQAPSYLCPQGPSAGSSSGAAGLPPPWCWGSKPGDLPCRASVQSSARESRRTVLSLPPFRHGSLDRCPHCHRPLGVVETRLLRETPGGGSFPTAGKAASLEPTSS